MKKILTFLGMMAISTTASFALLSETNTSDVDILRRQGFSESALKIVDQVKYNQRGMNGRYQKRFVTKPASSDRGRRYTYFKNYFDPIQDDNLFGMHQINFTNTWNGDETHYSEKRVDRRYVDDL